MNLIELNLQERTMKLEVGFCRDVFPNAGW